MGTTATDNSSTAIAGDPDTVIDEPKFTPGPWAVCDEAPNDAWYVGRTVYSPEQGRRVGDSGFFDHDELALANATLMAAAPEMYDAIWQALSDMDDAGHCVCEQTKQMLRAAILKAATGKARAS